MVIFKSKYKTASAKLTSFKNRGYNKNKNVMFSGRQWSKKMRPESFGLVGIRQFKPKREKMRVDDSIFKCNGSKKHKVELSSKVINKHKAACLYAFNDTVSDSRKSNVRGAIRTRKYTKKISAKNLAAALRNPVENQGNILRMIKARANVNTRDSHGFPLMHIAISWGHSVEVINALIRKNANLKQMDDIDWTPLFTASYHDRTDIAKVLVDNNVDVNFMNRYGETALNIAAKHGFLNMATWLLNNGANPCLKKRPDSTALSIAKAHRKSDMVTLLKLHLKCEVIVRRL